MRTKIIIALTLLSIAVALLVPAVPQPLWYHDFADRRAFLGIANFLDVVSNLGFLLAGIAGIAVVVRARTAFVSARERWPYGIFFAALLLTAIGSAYYHLAPDNERLFWDRLPMTIAFMSLISAQVVDRISARAGFALLVPMLLAGAGSAVYWIVTERAGAGNVVPYVVLQSYSMLVLLALAVLQPSRYTHGGQVYWVVAAYLIAKVFELSDREILSLGNIASGHTLKHLAAAVAGFFVYRMLVLRTPVGRDAPRNTAAVTETLNHR